MIWIVAYDTTKREWLPRASRTTRGWLRLGATGLLAVEVGRIVVLMTKDGFAVGDLIAMILDLIVFGYLLQGALVELGKTPGGSLYNAAVRVRATDPEKAMRLAARKLHLPGRAIEQELPRIQTNGKSAQSPTTATNRCALISAPLCLGHNARLENSKVSL